MRAKSRIFHQDCFRCRICEKPLVPGEEFALRGDGTLFCKVHNHEETAEEATTNGQPKLEELNNNNDIIEEAEMMDEDSVDSFTSVPGAGGGGDGPDSKSKSLKDEKGMFQGEDTVGLLDLLTSATCVNHDSLTQTQKPYFVNGVTITTYKH